MGVWRLGWILLHRPTMPFSLCRPWHTTLGASLSNLLVHEQGFCFTFVCLQVWRSCRLRLRLAAVQLLGDALWKLLDLHVQAVRRSVSTVSAARSRTNVGVDNWFKRVYQSGSVAVKFETLQPGFNSMACHLAAGDILQEAAQSLQFRRRGEGDSDAMRAEATSAAHAVHVRRRIIRQVHIGHLGQMLRGLG